MTSFLALTESLGKTFHFFEQGGFFMILLVACSVVSVAVIILRAMVLRRGLVMPPAIEREIEGIKTTSDERSVMVLGRMVQGDPSTLARLTRVAIQHLDWPKAENSEAVQTRARHEIVRLETGLSVLEVIVGVAPLLGLLGAVSGLVTVFANLGDSATVDDPRGIAKGISEALSTTVVGMGIAIPTLIAHSYFSKKIEVMASEMESLMAELLSKFYHHKSRRAQAGSLHQE